MIEASEVIDLVMALVLTPIIVTSLRTMPSARRRYATAGFVAIVVGYVFTILEEFVLPEALNVIEHSAYAVAGVLAVLALLQSRRSQSGGGR
ncbi:MAG: hypothetical protein ACYC77_03740 [Coriobacteriia bacterium]